MASYPIARLETAVLAKASKFSPAGLRLLRPWCLACVPELASQVWGVESLMIGDPGEAGINPPIRQF